MPARLAIVLGWVDGHGEVADVLWLLAAVAFVLCAAGRWASAERGRPPMPGWLLEVGLTLVAVGLLAT